MFELVNGLTYKGTGPYSGENFIEMMKESDFDGWEYLRAVNVYKRSPEDCPFNRGNWIIDFIFVSDETLCFKLPLCWSKEDMKDFTKGLKEKVR